MLRIWGRNNSINVMKVLWALAELEVPYERSDAGMQFGVVNEPYYRKLNPNGRVPTMDEDGFILWESNAIVRYLAARHGAGRLWPDDLRQRADADRWMDWATSMLQPAMTPLFWQLIRTPAEKRNAETIRGAAQQCVELFTLLDGCLAGRRYIAGPELTMGDIPLAPWVHRWYGLDVHHPPLPNVEAYYARMKQRPAYAANVALPLS